MIPTSTADLKDWLRDRGTRPAASAPPPPPDPNVRFSVGTQTHECYGHGSYGIETRICRGGAYGSGDFPPVFESFEDALRWINQNYPNDSSRLVVVLPYRAKGAQ